MLSKFARQVFRFYVLLAFFSSQSVSANEERDPASFTLSIFLSNLQNDLTENPIVGRQKIGSGVLIGENNGVCYLVTAFHTIQDDVSDRYLYVTAASDLTLGDLPRKAMKRIILTKVGNSSKNEDNIAIFNFLCNESLTPARIGNSLAINSEHGYLIGFPTNRTNVGISKIPIVFEKRDLSNNLLFLYYRSDRADNEINGISGGAVLTNEYELVAIHDGRPRSQENVLQGIPVDRIRSEHCDALRLEEMSLLPCRPAPSQIVPSKPIVRSTEQVSPVIRTEPPIIQPVINRRARE
jgi:hypothetical protein